MGNSYRMKGRVGQSQERLPLLVRQGVTGRVNLTRGDTFTFYVVCSNGRDADGGEVKGVMIVEKVEAE